MGAACRILIVDDDSSLGEALKEGLCRDGHDAIWTMKPEDALDLFQKQKFDFVLVDCLLPQMTGLEFVEKAHGQSKSPFKTILMSGIYTDKSFVQEMNKEGNKLFIRTLHSLASGMNLETVGEGAETLAEADILAKDGIDHIQGYAYGLPCIERLWLAADDEQRVSDQNSATPHTASVQ